MSMPISTRLRRVAVFSKVFFDEGASHPTAFDRADAEELAKAGAA